MSCESSPSYSDHAERGMTRQSTGAGPLWMGPVYYNGRDLHYDLEHHVTTRLHARRDTTVRGYGAAMSETVFGYLSSDAQALVRASSLFSVVETFWEILRLNISLSFLRSFMRWWWNTTNTFHFPWGEMTITPEDYTALTGLTFTAIPVRLRSGGPLPTVAEGTRLMGSWLGRRFPSYQARGIPYADLMWGLEHGVEESPLIQARLFYLHFITSTFLSGSTDTFDPRWIDLVEHVSSLGAYCWGDLGYATLVGQMSLAVRDSDPRRRHFVIALTGVPRLIELWAFEHLPWLAPRKGQRPLEYPAGRRWGWKKKLTARPPPDTVWDLIRDGNPEHVV
ncbi:protein MAINTENANCE OF MERISTEMS-like [Spinacia oleracea]|uniref:Protein MAINTENANCE OF MERISTEMS-like n=1 Tax=Spinacia oleracea TaxID=3562 RepID=A0ABM3RAZ2_SPIOL|nr:protein MAINTENANCE OF MERISTEMS-like [Spinacia oleracea]